MKYCLVFAIFVFSSLVVGQPIYKSVDADGSVTYSSTPIKNAAEVSEFQTLAGPSEEDVRAAEQRFEDLKQRTDKMEKDRKIREEKWREEKARKKSASNRKNNPPEQTNNYYYPYGNTYRPIGRPRPPMKPRPKPSPPIAVPPKVRPRIGPGIK